MVRIALDLRHGAANSASAEAQAARKFAGRPVADVLRELQAGGERIIFTSALVPPDIRVRTEPRAKERREIAREILEPYRPHAERRAGQYVAGGPVNAPGTRRPCTA